jgi:hypothetical protein
MARLTTAAVAAATEEYALLAADAALGIAPAAPAVTLAALEAKRRDERLVAAFRDRWEPFGSLAAFAAAHPQGWSWADTHGNLWLEAPASYYGGTYPYV